MQKDGDYIILFVDPKGTEHTDGYRKIDGYKKLFEFATEGGRISKNYSFEGCNIKVKLLLKSAKGIASVLDPFKKYWLDNFADFGEKLSL